MENPFAKGPGWTLVAETERIEVSSYLSVTDPNWRYTDAAGHEHVYMNGYPTLVRKVDFTYWCLDCHDEHEDAHLECKECGENIVPGVLGPSSFRQFVAGPTHFRLELADGRQIPLTQEDLEALGHPLTSDAITAFVKSLGEGVINEG